MNKKLMSRCAFEVDDLEVRAAEGEPTTIRGYAVKWERLSVDLGGFRERVRKGAFSTSLEKNDIKALWNHNTDMVLGSTRAKTLKLEEDNTGLRFELLPPDTQAGRDAVESIRRKDVSGVSFGFRVRTQEWDNSNPKAIVRTLIDVDAREISPTAFPAYPATNVSARSASDDYKEYLDAQAEDTAKAEGALELKKKYLDTL